MLLKQLAQEVLNAPMHNALAPVHNDGLHKWVVATRDLEPGTGRVSALTASLNALLADWQRSNKTFAGRPA